MAAPKRDLTIDGLKFVAAACIVLHHVARTSLAVQPNDVTLFVVGLTLPGLYFFFAVAGYLHGSLGNRGPAWLRKRFVRLAIPYLVWSVIYLFWESGHGSVPIAPVYMILLFAGAKEVLWSLPMLVICAVLAEVLIKSQLQRRIMIAVFVIATVLTLLFITPELISHPLRQFMLFSRWPMVYFMGMEIRAMSRESKWTSLAPVVVFSSLALAGVVEVLTLDAIHGVSAVLLWGLLDSVVAVGLLFGAHTRFRWYGARRLAPGGHICWESTCPTTFGSRRSLSASRQPHCPPRSGFR